MTKKTVAFTFPCARATCLWAENDYTTSSRLIDAVFGSAREEYRSISGAQWSQCLGAEVERGTSPLSQFCGHSCGHSQRRLVQTHQRTDILGVLRVATSPLVMCPVNPGLQERQARDISPGSSPNTPVRAGACAHPWSIQG